MLMWLMSDRAHPAQLPHDGRLRRPHLPPGQRARASRTSSSSTGSPSWASTRWPGTRRRRSPARTRTSTAATCGRRSTRGNFPEWELGLQLIDEDKAAKPRLRPARPDQADSRRAGAGAAGGPAGAQPQPRQLLRRDRAGGLPPGPRGARASTSATTRCCRGACSRTPTRSCRAWAAPTSTSCPINRGVCPFHNFQRDGMHRMTITKGQVSLRAEHAGQRLGVPRRRRRSRASRAIAEAMESPKIRRRSPSFDDHFSQATLFWNSQSPAEKEHIIAAFQFELSQGGDAGRSASASWTTSRMWTPGWRARSPSRWASAPPDAKAAAGRAGFREQRAKLPLESVAGAEHGSARRGAHRTPARWRCWWRRAWSSARCKVIQQALQDAGATSARSSAAHLGFVATSSGPAAARRPHLRRTCPR